MTESEVWAPAIPMAPAPDWIAHHALRRADQVAIRDLVSRQAHTYRELDERINALAGAFTRRGIGLGMRVGMLAANSANGYVVQFACQRVGAIFVPLNWRLTALELNDILKDSTPVLIVSDETHAEIARQIAASAGVEILSWSTDGSASEFEAALDRGDVPKVFDAELNTAVALLYTSGTAGRPKGVIYDHRMLNWNAIVGRETYNYAGDMANLVVLPMFHSGGLNTFANPAFYYGGSNVVLGTTAPPDILASLGSAEYGITHYMGVPALYQSMSLLPEFNECELPSVRMCGVGGASMPVETLSVWLEKGVVIQQVYAMTETGLFVLAQSREEAPTSLGTVGRPGIGVVCSIRDEQGKALPVGQVGELWVRSPSLTPGYWLNPEATTDALGTGWLRTGDALRQRADGQYEVAGRFKDMYISGGENVYPAEIENALFELRGVNAAAVIAVPDERWGEVGEAFVIEDPHILLTDNDYRDHFKARLAKYKTPKRVRVVSDLPRNALGKIVKASLIDGQPDCLRVHEIWA